MAQAGLSFANPFLGKVGIGETPNPYANTPTASIGLGGLAPSLTDMALQGERLVKQSQFTMPDMTRPPRGPDIAFSPSRKEVFVNGLTFPVDDATSALQSESYLRSPGTGLPKGGDWVSLDERAYAQYLDSIRNPSLGRLASKNFGRGVDVMQSLGGRALQLAGAEDLGSRIVKAQEQDLRRTAPYERQFTDIESGRGAVEWLVANFAQQGPNLIESVATAGLGFLGGTAVGGPAAGVSAAFAGLIGKSAWKESVKAALKKQATGEALNAAESKLIREAAGIAGAVATSYAQNLATGAADIYGELRERGADVNDTDARLKALAGSVPYALLETLPEYLLAGRIFGGAGAPRALPAGASLGRRGAELLRRGAVGGAVGGTAEGATEAGQEALLLGISGQDLSSPEAVNRLINSFAAGFGVGGPIGAVANLKGREPANLLNPAQNPDSPGTDVVPYRPTPPTAPGGAPFTDTTQRMPPAPPAPAALAGPTPTPQLGPPTTALPAQNAIMVTGQGELPSGPGTQGVLNIFGPEGVSAQELATRMRPPSVPQTAPAPAPAAPTPQPGQLPLQFAPAAPGAEAPFNPQMANQMQAIQARIQRQREFEAAQAQLAAQQQAQMNQIAQQSQNARDLFILQQQQAAAAAPTAQPALPMVPAQPRAPQQLPLFTPRQAPRPSRAEGLRRGGAAAALPEPQAPAVPARVDLRRSPQIPLFTQEGKPSLAALRAAGVKGKVTPTPAKGGKQAPPTGKRVTPQTVAKAKAEAEKKTVDRMAAIKAAAERVKAKEKKDAAQEGKLKQGRVAERTKDNEGVRAGRQAGEQPKTEVKKGGAETGGRGVTLKRGAKQEVKPAPGSFDFPIANVRRANGAIGNQGVTESRIFDVLTNVAGMKLSRDMSMREMVDAFKADTQAQQRLRDFTAQNPAVVTALPDGSFDLNDGNHRTFLLNQIGDQTVRAVFKTQPTQEATPPKKVEAAVAAVEVEALPPAEAWEDMKPDGAPEYTALSRAAQQEWAGAEARTMALAEKLAAGETTIEEREPTPAEILAEEIQAAEEATDISTFRDAIQTVIEYAFFTSEETNTRKLVEQAQAFINNTQFNESQMGAMDQAFLDAAQYRLTLEATYTRGGKKDQNKPWFSYALARNLLPSIKARLINLPAQYKNIAPAASGKITDKRTVELTSEIITGEPQVLLSELINDLISKVREVTRLDQEMKFRGKTFKNVVALAKDLYAKVSAEGKNFIVRGYKLSEYFNEDGTPKTLKSGGRYIITNKSLTKEQQRALEQEQKAEAKALAAERERLRKEEFQVEDEWDKPADEGRFYRDDGTPITSTVPAGRVKILVNSFLSKLRKKPTVGVYANVEDLRRRNPKLYERAAAARSNGDFGSVNAAGYSFGPNVIIFTDFIRTEQQLKFVLAHETLGHFGFRGIMPAAELDKVLNRIYDVDPDVRAGVDNMMEARGIPKSEAIEEYLADNAADLDTSIIARLWNVVKNFLNKLGFEFQDDEARYFINQARKYVRRGDTGNYVNAQSVVGGMEQLDADRDDGRYATAPVGDLASRAFAAGALNRRFGGTGGLTGAIESFANNLFGARKDVPGRVASILEQIQTLDNKARRSFGLNQVYRMLEKQQQFARSLLSKYQRMTQFTHSPDIFGFGKGVTEEQKEVAGELLARAALLRAAETTDALIKSYPSLVIVDDMGNITVDPRVREELKNAGLVTAEEFRKGFDVTYSNGEKVRFQYDVDENSPEWKIYLENRETVNEAAIDLMMSNYEAAQAETKRVINDLNRGRTATNVFTNDDLAAIRRVAEMYQNKRYEGSDVANAGVEIKAKANKNSEDFVKAFGRALFNDDVYAAWMKDPKITGDMFKDFEEFQKAEYDDIRAVLPSLRAKIRSKEESYTVQKAVRDLFMFDLQSKNADYYAKRTILGAYVPFTRRGTEQVRLSAVDAKGNPVTLDETVRATLPYFQMDSRSEALDMAEELEKLFEGEWTMLDDTGNEVTVRLVPEVSKTRQSPDLTEAVNFNEFVYVLNRLNVNIAPDVREKIITTLTNQNDRARKNLQRSGTEGWDKNVIRSVSEHLETSAHVAAKKLYRHRLDDIMLVNSNWLGDERKLKDLKAAVDSATTDGARARAQREYDQYAYMYRYMAGSNGKRTVEIDGEEVPTLGRGEDYREEAKQVLRWYSEATNITDSTEDLLSGEAGSTLKLWTVLMQLGGSVATAVINLASLASHSMPYLSYYNPSRGFGGGYGEAKAASALFRAARDVKDPNLSDDAFLNDLAEGRVNPADYNLTDDEALFLFKQTEEGTLQAAQFNALVGTARGKVFNNKAQAAVKAWMSLFSYTEQFNRRVTALAAYRLEKERALAQGLTEEQAIKAATEAAREAVNSSQGEYAMFNRPEMARGNVLQYVFMYKQFVIVTVQLLRSLPVKGQLLMLGFLLLTSGLKGLPFAEDIFDIVDTIAQKLGLKMASVEKELAEWIDSVAPGMTPFVMRGVLDRVTGATISTRLGMGDLVPLTGAFRAGADPAREVADFAGPVFSGISGLVGMAGSLGRYGAEVVGLRDDLTSINGILRDSPVAALRAMGDSYAYLNSGMITNAKGQVVAKEAPYHVIFARMMGFYPAIASEQNDIVRLSKYVGDYSKAIKAEYVSAYVKATLEGDREKARDVANAVQEWNEGARGTGLEIRTFEKDAARAAIEAGRPTALRYLRSAPRQMRPETIELLQAYGLYDEIR